MCTGNILKTAVSPISTSLGRSAMTTGIAGAIASGGKKKKSAPVMPVSLAPNEALRNSSLYNSMGG